MKKGNKTLALILSVLCLLAAVLTGGCAAKNSDPGPLENAAVMHEEEFGGVYIDMTIEDFNALGFAYGDGVTVAFSNGYRLENVPYYNGYYTQTGQPLLVAYPGYPYIKACINNGDDLWALAALTESDTATVTLAGRGAYAAIQNARDIHYKDDRSLFESDAVFANFRSVKTTGLAENVLYRSASPCDNQHNRAHFVDRLIEAAGVNCIVNLSDNESKIEGYLAAEDFNSPYFLSLYQNGKVLLLSMNMNYTSDEFKSKLASGLSQMAGMEGPYLVHCTEGKDRTGFVCILLEAFAGASYEEIVADYMLTYDNYYKITEASDPAKYSTIKEKNVDAMLKSILGDPAADLAVADLAAGAEKYLLNAGMAEADVAALHGRLEK
jgi:protein tyrosine/serine phosphatase